MRMAVIRGGKVENVIEAHEGYSHRGMVLVPDPDGQAMIGGAWDGIRFIAPQEPSPTPEQQRAKRQAAFRLEADPLYIEAEAERADGNDAKAAALRDEWRAKRREIKQRFPIGG